MSSSAMLRCSMSTSVAVNSPSWPSRQKRWVMATADSTSIHESAPKPSTLTSSAPYPRLRLPSTTFHAMVAEDTSMATRRYQRRSGGLCDDFSAVALLPHRARPTWGEAALNSDI